MSENKASDLIDVSALLKQYLSKWYLFVISVCVCCLLALFVIKVRKPTYGVRANVLIQVDSTNPLSSMGAIGELMGSKGNVDDEVYVISSHSLLRDAVKALGINQTDYVRHGFLNVTDDYPDNPLHISTPEGVADTLSVALTFKVKVNKEGLADIKVKKGRFRTLAKVKKVTLPITIETPYGPFTVSATKFFPKGDTFKGDVVFMGYHPAAEELAENISMQIASKKSNAIELAYDTKNEELGRDVLNEIIKLYNERGIREKNLQGEKTAEFIKKRLEILGVDLSDAELAIEHYKQNHKLTDIEVETGYQITKKGQLEQKLIQAETNYEILKLTYDFLKNPENAYSMVPFSNTAPSDAILAYNELVLKRMQLQASAKADNAMLKIVSDQIDSMRSNIITSVQKQLDAAGVTVKELRNERASADSRLGAVPTQEREFLNLKRDQLVKQNIYTFLLQRNEETALLLANSVPKGIIVDEAYSLSEPIGLSKKAILLLGFVFGLILPPVYLSLRKIILNRYDSREEMERELVAPVLGEMCKSKEGSSLVVGPGKTSSATELFKLMRANLLFMLNGENDKVVLLTSSRSGEGKSFISLNLAASLAQLQDRSVLLVGMDIRKPQLANYLGIAPTPGLTEYLAGSITSLDAIIRHDATPLSNLDVIVAGPVPPNPAELLSTKRVDALFQDLRKRYDFIIIDSAPVGMVSDTFSLNRLADATVYVTRVNYSHIADLNFANRIYREKRLKNMSVVINGTTSKQGYGYGYK
jgi:capsular exopolysaccharide family